MKRMIPLSAFVGVACAVRILMAETAIGVNPTLIARGIYDPFKVKSDPHSIVDFEAKAKYLIP
jgi:hypothetical protein